MGEGVGHVFKVDMKGNLLADLRIGEGAIYHPGGIDYDGRYIWVPVTEYRPNSRSIIYRVDPITMKADRDVSVRRFTSAPWFTTLTTTPFTVSAGARGGFIAGHSTRRRQGHQRRHAAGEVADDEPVALRGLSGLQITLDGIACCAPA